MFGKEELQKLYRYSYSLTCDEHDAYDLLQSSLEKFISSKASVNQPIAYIKKIIYYRFIDECRRKKIIQFESLEDAALPSDFDVQTLEEILVNENLAKNIMQSLEPDEREILYCWGIEGFSTSEISKKMGVPKGTILSKIYRMRKKLLEQFDGSFTDVTEAK
jgi:RNA polymerase sigma-70 factor, ECF subfamily